MEKLKSLSTEEYLKYGLHLAVLTGVVLAAIKYLNGEAVFKALRNFDYGLAPYILGLATLYLLIKAGRFVLLMEPFKDGLARLITFKAYVAGQAATLLPGGVAARAGLLKQVGVPVAQSGVPVVFSSGIDQIVFIVGALVAALWFETARLPVAILLAVLTAVAVLFLIPATRRRLQNGAEWAADKLGVTEKWHNFLEAVPAVFTWSIMAPAFVLTLLAFAGKIVALDLALRGVGVNLDYPTLFLGFIIPTMLGRMVPVPGGVGVTEASMVGFLASTSSAGPDQMAAAVAVFRVGTIFFQALLGAAVYFLVWDGEREMAVAPSTDAAT